MTRQPVVFTADDQRFMARAIQLARKGRCTTAPNPSVGCVIVQAEPAGGEQIVGEGWHRRAGEPHAEIHALRAAGRQARGATAYVTLEPCSHYGRTPPCAEALIEAGVSRVVAAMVDPNPQVAGRGLAMLRAAGIETQAGLLEAGARELNPGFIQRMESGRPRVTVKLAMSLDGRTAMASGESQWITGPDARADVMRFRAASCAILSGSGTVLADNPSLNVRFATGGEGGEEQPAERQPLRVIVDGKGQVGPQQKLFQLPGPVLLVRTAADDRLYPGQCEQLLLPVAADRSQQQSAAQRVDLNGLLMELGRRSVNQIWVEAGPGLAGALLAEQLVDEIIIYMAPKLMGDTARGLFTLPGLERMADAVALELTDLRQVGRDIRLCYRPVYTAGQTAV